MNQTTKTAIRDLSFLLVGAVLVLVPNLTSEMPGRDSGVFLYAGSRILEGDVPYRDFWDHKGPLIYFVNALGVWLSPNSEIGIWGLELIVLLFTIAGLYFLLRNAFSATAALLGSAVFLGSLAFVLLPGNYTEEFSLPLAVGALLLFQSYVAGHQVRWQPFVLGLLFAATVLLRPTNAGITLAIGGFLLVRGLFDRRRIKDFVAWIIGAAVLMLLVLLYFAANSAVSDLWDQVLTFNSAYVLVSPKAMVGAVLEGYRVLAPTGVLLLATVAWVWATYTAARAKTARNLDALLQVMLLALPIELVLVAASGRSLNHYYIMWLPAAGVLAACLFWMVFQMLPEPKNSQLGVYSSKTVITVALLAGTLILPARRVLPASLKLVREGPRDLAWIEGDLKSFGQPYLLMWGAESSFNYLSGIASPSRYVYQYPLYTCGYVTDAKVREFHEAIVEKNPLIVDTSLSNALVPPLDSLTRQEWRDTAEGCSLTEPMEELLRFLDRNYQRVDTLSRFGWPIYHFAGYN
ncbi:MAG: glycosyltransferase family 39 protein [Anaerolineales bacterium]